MSLFHKDLQGWDPDILQAQFQRMDIQSFLKTKTFRSFFSWTPNSWGIPNPWLFLIILAHSAVHRKCMRLTTSGHTSNRIWRATYAMCIICPFCQCQSNFKAQKRHCTHLETKHFTPLCQNLREISSFSLSSCHRLSWRIQLSNIKNESK